MASTLLSFRNFPSGVPALDDNLRVQLSHIVDRSHICRQQGITQVPIAVMRSVHTLMVWSCPTLVDLIATGGRFASDDVGAQFGAFESVVID